MASIVQYIKKTWEGQASRGVESFNGSYDCMQWSLLFTGYKGSILKPFPTARVLPVPSFGSFWVESTSSSVAHLRKAQFKLWSMLSSNVGHSMNSKMSYCFPSSYVGQLCFEPQSTFTSHIYDLDECRLETSSNYPAVSLQDQINHKQEQSSSAAPELLLWSVLDNVLSCIIMSESWNKCTQYGSIVHYTS